MDLSNLLVKLGIDPKEYQEFTDEEKEVVNKIILEKATSDSDSKIINNGNPSLYESLYYEDYDEIPVDFETFITDDYYLGKSLRNGTALYPFWREELKKIFNTNTAVEVAFSGAIGIGKTMIGCVMLTYHLYKTMCLKHPQEFFNLTPGSEITYAFINNTLESSKGTAFKNVQEYCQASPWFLKHGSLRGREMPLYYPGKNFGFVVGSRIQHTLGRHVIGALMDEVSFAPGQNVNYAASKIMGVYTNIRRRMDSRFIVEGHNYGLMIFASSKSTDFSFLESYIADQIKKGYPIYVVDQPQWVVKPKGTFSSKTFKIAVGNKYLRSKLIEDKTENQTKEDYEAILESLIKQGYRILDVPIDLKQPFDQDIDKALQDLAGISTSVVTKPFDYQRIVEIIKPIHNPFMDDIITMGMDDTLQLKDFFDATLIPKEVLSAPVFIHLDASVSNDKTGLAAVAIVGSRKQHRFTDTEEGTIEVDELVFQTVFTVAIKAPTGSQISFEKTRQFIYYLKDEVGLNVKHISTDNFQSYDTRQILATKGFDVGYTSLDRTPYGYDGLKMAINERRFYLLEGCRHVIDELTDIEKDNMSLKWDHPVGGCFPANQLVQTDHGIKYIVDLDIEKDKVLSYNIKRNLFSYTKFRNLRMTKTVKELCKVSLKFNRYLESSFTCTLDHPILLSNNQYIEASNLKQGNILQSCSNYTVEVDKVEIITSKKPIPVYDIEVPKHNNFVLDNGVVVHNSKDTSDALAGAYLDASQYKDEFMFYHPAEFEYEDINDNSTSQEKLQRELQDSFLKAEIQNAIKSVKGNKDKDDSGSIQRLNKEKNKENYEDYLDSLLDSNILFL